MTRKFDPHSVSYPVHAALETLGITDPEERGAVWEWAGLIGDRAWGRYDENAPTEYHTALWARKTRIRDRVCGAFTCEHRRAEIAVELRANLRRAVDFAKAQPAK